MQDKLNKMKNQFSKTQQVQEATASEQRSQAELMAIETKKLQSDKIEL